MPLKHRYLPTTDQDRQTMMETIGITDTEALFADIPEAIRYRQNLNVSKAMNEPELLRYMRNLANKNADFERYASFLGAGMYDHHLPVVIQHMISRSEFYTAYTPYQPEISQGELQAIFEFQSYICELTGMAVANASMYDGSTALGEAAALAHGATRRKQILISQAVHPEARQIVRTVAKGLDLEVKEIGCENGVTNVAEWERHISPQTAAVLIQSPNFYGCIEDVAAVRAIADTQEALLIVSCNPLTLGLLEAPGHLGADIVVGDAQPFGIPAAFGGPSCGFFSVSEKLMRRMPGRIVGQTTDIDGKRGFVLTLQAREQHIRREKATSNICSNQALLALCASIYLSVMGKQGIRDVANLNVQKAHYAARTIGSIPGFELAFTNPFFNEFTVKVPQEVFIQALNEYMLTRGFIGGYDLERDDPALRGHLLIAVTEQRTREEIDQFADALRAFASQSVYQPAGGLQS